MIRTSTGSSGADFCEEADSRAQAAPPPVGGPPGVDLAHMSFPILASFRATLAPVRCSLDESLSASRESSPGHSSGFGSAAPTRQRAPSPRGVRERCRPSAATMGDPSTAVATPRSCDVATARGAPAARRSPLSCAGLFGEGLPSSVRRSLPGVEGLRVVIPALSGRFQVSGAHTCLRSCLCLPNITAQRVL